MNDFSGVGGIVGVFSSGYLTYVNFNSWLWLMVIISLWVKFPFLYVRMSYYCIVNEGLFGLANFFMSDFFIFLSFNFPSAYNLSY